jgi:1,4-dihydroxy-2-naphthoyl-CoA hydrolase
MEELQNIWNKENLDLEKLNEGSQNSAVSHLGIVLTKYTKDSLSAKMPVDSRTVQPYGILHGGASCVLAETLGSIAANCVLKSPEMIAVGQEINANHIRPASSGYVLGTAQAIHLGRSSQVWEIKIKNENEKLICISRLTLAIIKKQKQF